MSTLLENPLPAAAVGAVLATVALLAFLSRHNLASLIALAAILFVTAALVLLERLVVTPREQVETAIAGLMTSIERNDAAAVVAAIDPAATRVVADVQALMPQIRVEKARAMGTIEVTLDETAAPPAANSRFQAFLDGVHQRSGMRVAYFNQRVDVHWIRRDDRWLVDGYAAYFDGQPIDAVSSAAGNRPVRAP